MIGNVELGDFLQSRRIRLRPESLGLKTTVRRRTPGLRREEVAERAGISTDWYVRLEQGRAVSPSDATIDALAYALVLSAEERSHLRSLAGRADRPGFVLEKVPPTIRKLVLSLSHPAYVAGQRWDVLVWNNAAAELFWDFGVQPEGQRNLLIFVFLDERARALFGESWARIAKSMLAQFRATHDLWSGDAAFADLVEDLRGGSSLFARWWKDHDVRQPISGRKTFFHHKRGVLQYDHASFQANDNPALKLVMYVPVE